MSCVRKLCAMIAFMLLTLSFYGQKKHSRFGKADPAELTLKNCAFEPDADMVCLLEEGTVMYNLSGHTPVLETEIRKKFKVFKASAMDDANIKITYYSKDRYEDVNHIDGYVYNVDDQGQVVTTKLSNSDIYRKKLNDEYSEVTFALPNVKVGSVFEYRYRQFRYSFSNIQPWYFQHEYPTVYSEYNLRVPEYFDFKYSTVRRQEMKIDNKGTDEGTVFVMENIPSLHEEPYMAGTNDFLQRVTFHLTTIHPPGEMAITVGKTWEGILTELLDNPYYGQQLHRNIRGTESLKSIIDTCRNKFQKLSAIYRYVQQNMGWDGDYEIFPNDEGIKTAWDKKNGSTADINLILVNLLQENDLEAYPLLVSTRDHGSVYATYPDLFQFNATLATCIIDSTTYILNAADKYNPVGLTPYEVQYTHALIANKKHMRWLSIFDQKKKDRTNLIISLNLLKDGKINGFGNVSYYDYARNRQLAHYEKKDLKDQLTTQKSIELIVDSFEVKNVENSEKPLNLTIDYSGSAQGSGKYALIPYQLFLGFDQNPFTAEKRQTDINFGFLQDYKINGYLNFADNYSLESLPKSMAIRMADSSILFRRIFQKSGEHQIAYQLSIQILRPEFSSQEYPDIRSFYKKMYELLDEKIVLKSL